MLNRTITLDQMLSWLPWYSREKVLQLLKGKTELTVAEVLTLDVSSEDKLRLLLREELLPARLLHEFMLWCAETALTRTKSTNKRCRFALKVKRAWLAGKATDEELDAAWKAALGAAWEPAEFAAESAVWKVAGDGARNTAANAAGEVNSGEQLAKLKEMLRIQTT